MAKNDSKDQIPLFELPTPAKPDPPPPPETSMATVPEMMITEKKPKARRSPATPAAGGGKSRAAARPDAKRGKAVKAAPGPVPEGDVRLTANVREDLHLRLKIAAATRRTTIGELIEELVELHL